MPVRIKRIYAPPAAEDGYRLLVDRLWPRGLTREKAAIDDWRKDLAPSSGLRQWFAHDPGRWAEFQSRYRAELEDRSALVDSLLQQLRDGSVTLLFAARDEVHNHAAVLRDFLHERENS